MRAARSKCAGVCVDVVTLFPRKGNEALAVTSSGPDAAPIPKGKNPSRTGPTSTHPAVPPSCGGPPSAKAVPTGDPVSSAQRARLTLLPAAPRQTGTAKEEKLCGGMPLSVGPGTPRSGPLGTLRSARCQNKTRRSLNAHPSCCLKQVKLSLHLVRERTPHQESGMTSGMTQNEKSPVSPHDHTMSIAANVEIPLKTEVVVLQPSWSNMEEATTARVSA